ncbi:MAG TPA: DUF4399 domain-containing protein [Immundisolibacter sp.]|nr:DUF4399 domain-containing protein [Immundisolibacter sp.]
MKTPLRSLALPLLLISPLLALAATPAPPGAEVYFISPKDGETVSGPVTVRFGLKGMGVAPAGMQKDATGHHHLLIDADLPPLDQPVPTDDHHKHFGAGQTETVITLPPGKHTLQLLLGDFAHTPHEPPVMSPKITIEVK